MPNPAEIGSFKKVPQPPVPEQADKTASVIQAFMEGTGPKFTPAVAPTPEDGVTTPPTEEVLQQAVDAITNAPEMTYEQRLKAAGITKEDAMRILDALLSQGYYEQTYQLTSKTRVTFRTRGLDAHDDFQHRLEDAAPQYSSTMSLLMSKIYLARSLVALGERKFDPSKPEETLKFLTKMPFVLFNVLCQKLSKFDAATLVAMDEGAIANF